MCASGAVNTLCCVWKSSCVTFQSLIHAYNIMYISDACNCIFETMKKGLRKNKFKKWDNALKISSQKFKISEFNERTIITGKKSQMITETKPVK